MTESKMIKRKTSVNWKFVASFFFFFSALFHELQEKREKRRVNSLLIEVFLLVFCWWPSHEDRIQLEDDRKDRGKKCMWWLKSWKDDDRFFSLNAILMMSGISVLNLKHTYGIKKRLWLFLIFIFKKKREKKLFLLRTDSPSIKKNRVDSNKHRCQAH